MKTHRPQHLAVVIGRNRRVYARVYQMPRYIEAFSQHYLESERRKAFDEGFIPVGLSLEKPNDLTWIYRVEYAEI